MQETQPIVSDPLSRPIVLKKKVPKNSIILSKNNYAPIDSNILCLGDIGSGKTRNVILPNIVNSDNSMIILDNNGHMLRKVYHQLLDKGYTLRIYNPTCKKFIDEEIAHHDIELKNGGISLGCYY